MFRKVINSFLFLPISLCINSEILMSSEVKYNANTNNSLETKLNKPFIGYSDIEKIIINNQELKSLQKLVSSARFNLYSQISQRFPSLDFQANGLPKYVSGESFNSNTDTLKTSQFSANPSLNIKWDLIDPLRGSEIKIAKENYKIAKNNYEIKKKDLIQESRKRLHQYQKSYQDIQNKKFTLDLSITSLNNAKAKLNAGIGTKFEVLEAETQLSRDKQSLNEKKIEHKINEISFKEILNINSDFEIDKEQTLIGFWNYKLIRNINEGIDKNLSLKNSLLQRSIKENQAKSFLSQNKPKIYLSNTFSSSFTKGDSLSPDIDSNEYGSNYSNTVSLNFAWNIFNGGQNMNSYKSKIADAEAEIYAFENLKNILRTNITKSYLNLKLNEEKIISSFKEIESSKESLRLTRLRYDVGISTLRDVLERQNELSIARTKNINAIFNYNLNLDDLERLTFLEISKYCVNENNNKIKDKESICNIPR